MAAQIGFILTNLASDVPNLAQSTDPDLVNAWGMAAKRDFAVLVGGKRHGNSPFPRWDANRGCL